MGEQVQGLKTRYSSYSLRKPLQLNFQPTLCPSYVSSFLHNFEAAFQEEQYKIFLETFPYENIMFTMDFAKNYTFMDFNDIQEMH